MSEEANKADETPAEQSGQAAPAAVEHDKGTAGSGDFTTELDPTFVPDDSGETPDAKRAREDPEETGS